MVLARESCQGFFSGKLFIAIKYEFFMANKEVSSDIKGDSNTNDDIKKLAESLHPLERKVLPFVIKHNLFSKIEEESKLSYAEVMRAIQWLSNKKAITTTNLVEEQIVLGKNGEVYKREGLPEKRLLRSLSTKELSVKDAGEKAELNPQEVQLCIGLLKQKAAITIRKDDISKELKLSISDYGKQLLSQPTLEEKFLQSTFPKKKEKLPAEEEHALETLLKRKNILSINIIKDKEITITDIGKKILASDAFSKAYIDAITPELLQKGSWKGKEFRRYDVSINVPTALPARKHFVTDAIKAIRKIWIELGFEEMQGNFVQTSFWDLDALFVPQDHPARQLQDTFYIKDPNSKKLKILEGTLPKIYKKIKAVHEDGGDTGSDGWGEKWEEGKAKEVLLRTHTTVLSAQTLSNLKKEDLPKKFFSLGKVFRNEALDWKHLAEFHQVEGIVIDPNATFQHLIGYLKEFYGKMGYGKIRIRPHYFPYTEPSAEIDVFHPIKKEWIELGGCGIFRPEVVKPLLGFDCPVLAWGFGMERIITAYYEIQDLRELYSNNLDQLQKKKAWIKSYE